MNKKKIGIFIKEKRIELGLTQDDLASKLHVDRTAISKWERGIYPVGTEYLLKLSEILKVSVNEILASEEKQVENEEYIDNFSIQVIENSKKMQKRIIKYFVLIILVLCLLFFIYYFILTYNKIQIYYFSLDGDNFYMEESLAFFSNEEVYINFDDAQSKKDDYEISYVEVYYIKDDVSNLIFSSDNLSGIVFQSKGYDEYFSFNDTSYLIDSLYVDIHYYDNEKEEVETTQFTFEKIYTNSKLFLETSQKISYETISNDEIEDVPSLILETFDINEDGNYISSYSVDDIDVSLAYLVDSEIFWVVEISDDYIKDYQFFKSNGSYKYALYDVNSSLISESEYVEENINCLTGNCDNDLEKYLYFKENYVNKYFRED